MVEEGKIGTVIVKDMSRLGRDYLQVGMYTEMVFPNADIRFIAINNSVAVSSLYLLRYLCNIIQNQLRFEEKQKAQRTDKKLQQKINDKKQAQGLKNVR